MADARGQAHALTILTPVTTGREQELRGVLEGLGAGPASPLARLAATHFARWVVIGELVYGGERQKPDRLQYQQLLFTANFDGERDDYLAAMRTRIAAEADAIWGNCPGYPGAGEASAFSDYLLRHAVPTGLFVAPYPHATVAAVRAGLEARERLLDLALRADGLDAAELQTAFRATFPAGGR